MSSERTEEATPKKRQDARQKGQIARSADLTSAAGLGAGFAVLISTRGTIWDALSHAIRAAFIDVRHPEQALSQPLVWATPILTSGIIAMAPVCLAAAGAAALVQAAQVGPLLTGRPLQMDWTRINPFTGIQRMLTLRTAVELAKGILKCLVIAFIMQRWFVQERDNLLQLGLMPAGAGADLFLGMCGRVVMRVSGVFLVMGAVDYLYQKIEQNRNLRMTRQEIKEENREQDGDPQLRARIRQVQRQMASGRMMSDVPKADVVITNPTHYAVAIQYDAARHAAPVVVAKGQRLVAERIRDVARRHGVPIIQKPPLARALYRSVEIGHPIPDDLYRAVAELLAFIYRAYGRKA